MTKLDRLCLIRWLEQFTGRPVQDGRSEPAGNRPGSLGVTVGDTEVWFAPWELRIPREYRERRITQRIRKAMQSQVSTLERVKRVARSHPKPKVIYVTEEEYKELVNSLSDLWENLSFPVTELKCYGVLIKAWNEPDDTLPLTGTPLPMINHPMFPYDKETPE